ncbi:MAG: CoA-binding protein [Bryobacterales bacterium]|nr:CoA-binding protein [Bryobacterales bacterium]
MSAVTSLTAIQQFLANPRVAILGVSRNPNAYSQAVLSAFLKEEYQALPINPNATDIEGIPCFHSVLDIKPAPAAAVLLVPEDQLAEATRDCLRAGVHHLWFRHKETPGSETTRAAAAARVNDANVISGECPLMFLPSAGWVHRAHGFLAQLVGQYPK